MEEFYIVLNNYYIQYETALGRNPKRANGMKPRIEMLNINLNKFLFNALCGDYKACETLLQKMASQLSIAKLSPVRKVKAADIEKYFKG